MHPGYVGYKLPKDECVLTKTIPDHEVKEFIDSLSKNELGIGMNIRVKPWYNDLTFINIHFKRQHKEAFLNTYERPDRVVQGRTFPQTYEEQHYLDVLEPLTDKVNVIYLPK